VLSGPLASEETGLLHMVKLVPLLALCSILGGMVRGASMLGGKCFKAKPKISKAKLASVDLTPSLKLPKEEASPIQLIKVVRMLTSLDRDGEKVFNQPFIKFITHNEIPKLEAPKTKPLLFPSLLLKKESQLGIIEKSI